MQQNFMWIDTTFIKMRTIFIIYILVLEIHLIRSRYSKLLGDTERTYMEYYMNLIDEDREVLCDWSTERKYAICDKILSSESYKEDMDIYFNKAAAFNMKPDCVTVPISFLVYRQFDIANIRQKMFPCFGRHNPMRTDWQTDDYLHTIYLSAGNIDDSVIVYIHEETATGDHRYLVSDIVFNIKLSVVEPMIISKRDVDEELLSSGGVTYNYNPDEIEANFLRNHSYTRIDRSIVCDLNWEQKLDLCKKYFADEIVEEDNWTLNEDAFRTHSTRCQKESLEMTYQIMYDNMYDNMSFEMDVFECYGKPAMQDDTIDSYYSTGVYISAGFRPNSFIIFSKNDNTKKIYICVFVENYKIPGKKGSDKSEPLKKRIKA